MKEIPPPHDDRQEPHPEGEPAAEAHASPPSSPSASGVDSPHSPHPAIDEERLRAILRGSARRTTTPSLLAGVQQRIRERSRGRFYADGWSRSRSATSTYVVTSLLALGIFLLAYFVLIPTLPVR